MSNNYIKKQTFLEADEHTQKAMTFDLLQGISDRLDKQLIKCESRFKCLEGARRKNAAYATLGGFGGGLMAFFAQWFFIKK